MFGAYLKLFEGDAPETDLLFYKNVYQKEFDAKILDVVEKDGTCNLIFDKTVFYPEGGGQPSDIGIISIEGKVYEIEYASKINNVILHQVTLGEDEDASQAVDELKKFIGTDIHGAINWNRRITLARHHTGTHLVIAASV